MHKLPSLKTSTTTTPPQLEGTYVCLGIKLKKFASITRYTVVEEVSYMVDYPRHFPKAVDEESQNVTDTCQKLIINPVCSCKQ